jgi:hypothetical protein
MENLACIIVVFAAYCFWACTTYHDRPFCCTPDPIAPVDYFPEIEEKAIATPTPKTKPIIESMPMPQAAFKSVTNTVKTAPMASEKDLMTQSIRSLKSLAKGRVKSYSSLTKKQLSSRLAGMVTLAEI